MSMMRETDQNRLRIQASGILEGFLQAHITLREAVADLGLLCRLDLCHLNGPALDKRLADTLVLAANGEIDAEFALSHLVRLATTHVLCVEAFN
ncbi:MAG: hypothetical protein QM647_13910 [Asticcacaulis sp.]|uniref:hypothetical protein n=1 Tax=Asticcacaulis sp. TaxID=1872648 RepID=UPI0039E67A07